MAYQFGERTKSELLVASQLVTFVADLREEERKGGKRVLLACLDFFRNEIAFAQRSTGMQEFNRAANSVSEAISYIESDSYSDAGRPLGNAISAATTAAQKGWQVLSEHGLI
ncbi:MAG: hypothetical protein QHG99_08320 [Methanomicrobiales archaeon]|nr:hypothetical protein [Methanomicrobiales archaeon]